MVIYIVNKCADYDGHLMYKHNSLVGVYDNYDIAKYDVMQKLKKCKYEIEFDTGDYFFVKIIKKYGILPFWCYEIIEKNMNINEICLREPKKI